MADCTLKVKPVGRCLSYERRHVCLFCVVIMCCNPYIWFGFWYFVCRRLLYVSTFCFAFWLEFGVGVLC